MPRRPNILFSLSDDQRHDAMGCAGHPFLETPAMDRLAREGIRCRNAFTACPLCAPSRASLLSGQYPHQNGVLHNQAALRAGVQTWPELLQQSGYRTGFIGKIHFGNSSAPRPGFERWISFHDQGEYRDPLLNVDGVEVRHQGYNTDLLAEYAEQFLSSDDPRPWALCVWWKAPHAPFTPPERYADVYSAEPLPVPPTLGASRQGKSSYVQNARWFHPEPAALPYSARPSWDRFMRDYARTLRGVDDGLGRLLAALDGRGDGGHTLVIHSSDHGYFHGEFGFGDKRWMYDPSIRVPLLIRYPVGIRQTGRVEDALISNLDLPATIMDLAALDVPPAYHGHSLRPLLLGEGRWQRDAVFIEYFQDPPYPYWPSMVCMRTAQAKLIRYFRQGESEEYYDLTTDPNEQHNALDDSAQATTVTELRRRLEQTLRHDHFVLPEPLPDAF
ncbi:MAG: sulfatase [Chloroflexi bacterium]|nr:sulfatase [Chloroflexota bacterium]